VAYLHVSDFKFGMDRRRPQHTGVPGTLWNLKNAFVSRGGDIVRAKKFVSAYTLASGTFGLASVKGQLYVFGSAAAPTMPPQVQYQRLQASSATMVRVLDVVAYAGKIYAIAEFNDGGVYHFYDGTRVTDWDTISDANSSFAQVAEVLARKITAAASVDAQAVGEKVIITAVTPGTAFTCVGAVTDNGAASTPAATATQLVANVAAVTAVRATGTVTITGGSAGALNTISSVTVNAVELLAATVAWIGSNPATANALAIAVNNNSTTSGYTAEASGSSVTIRAAVGTGTTPNGYVVAATVGGTVTVGTANMAGGVAAVTAVAQVYEVAIGSGTFDAEDLWKITIDGTLYQTTGRGAGAGTSAYVYRKRIYSTAGSLLRYCVLSDPTDWTTTAVTATDSGLINMSSDSEGSQQLLGAATYQGDTAIFGRDTIRIYTLSADADENTIVDTLEQTGTMAAGSIIAYGNLDVFYLDDSGIRSIRTRDGYNAAYVSDVGSAIDAFVQAYMAEAGEETVSRAVAAIDVIEGRYWLAIDERIFALSYYPSSKITAWSYIEPGFEVQELVRVGKRIYVRSGNTIYLYGGAAGTTYPSDNEQNIVAETVFMSANDPAGRKRINGFDMGGENDWYVELLVDPDDTTKAIPVGTVNCVTYNLDAIKVPGHAALVALRFTCDEGGDASLSNFALHYDKGKAE